MTTVTKAKNTTDGYKDISNSLPPFCTLAIGETMEVKFLAFQSRTEDVLKRGKKVGEKEKISYRMELLDDVTVTGHKEGAKSPKSFKAGEIITLGGAGAIDRTFAHRALELDGQKPEAYDSNPDVQVPWEKLEGRVYRITRKDDTKKKHGEYAGNKVKVYLIQEKA